MSFSMRHGILSIVCILAACAQARAENRTINGTGNNVLNPAWGAAGSQLLRKTTPAYADGVSEPSGAARPNPREISNTIVAQTVAAPNIQRMTDWVFQWGQFVDHDLDLTGGAAPAEPFSIAIPTGDLHFDPTGTGTAVMSLSRSNYDPLTGTGPGNPRQQVNQITSYIDGSNVYGSDDGRATALRTLSGGQLKTSAGNLLPLNTLGLPNETGGPASPSVAAMFYVAGDVRVNEQVGLTAVHTLFMREHNRLADQIALANPGWDDEQIYQRARKLVGAEIQAITYQEFLPALLGSHAPGLNGAYDPNVNATVANEFSTALFRVGHTMLSPQLMRRQADGTDALGGHLALREAFFKPSSLAAFNELEYLLKGLASEQQQEVDMHVVDDVRNFLFGPPIPGGFDLASLNIQRGRDHGLPSYNEVRLAYGLPQVASFTEITSDAAMQAGLALLYGDVSEIDPWVGALSEDHLAGAAVGPLVAAGLIDQFTRARDGDRFWFCYDLTFSDDDVDWLTSLRLSDVIMANTSIGAMQRNVFFMVPEPSTWALTVVALAGMARISRRPRRSNAAG